MGRKMEKERFAWRSVSQSIHSQRLRCLEYPAKVPLEIIEVQSCSYSRAQDSVCFEDRYGRVT
ncbi:MAG TPA: mannose-1-phosphate guanylyltransferase/mannose-6-phosphate isomerase, partial [Gammaproteobacteria bacterium]|nr:mannose-1-phosphate guanylyltransferase/mannose-6-phosphate isomerase [Gammaproteobacteria bacterium]